MIFKVGDQTMLPTNELLDAAEMGKLRPRWEGLYDGGRRRPWHVYSDPVAPLQVQSHCKRPQAQALPARLDSPDPGPTPGSGRSPVVEQLLKRKTLRGRTYFLG